MISFAPVLIPTLHRYKHFRRCIESLTKCTHSEKTELYIALDYPANDTHWEGYEKIKSYLPEIRGFKKIIIIKREENFGPRENTSEARIYIYEQHDRIIISEDDNYFSPNFLDYINKGLEEFKNNNLVSSICGYKYPFEIPADFPYNYYYSQGFSAWGYGTWKEKDMSLKWGKYINQLNCFLHKPWEIVRLYDIQYGLLTGLMYIVRTKKILGDRMYCYFNLRNKTYCIFPTISKVRNHGHDGSGEHSLLLSENNIFIHQQIDRKLTFNYKLHQEYFNKDVYKAFAKHNHQFNNYSFTKKIKIFIKYFIYFFSH